MRVVRLHQDSKVAGCTTKTSWKTQKNAPQSWGDLQSPVIIIRGFITKKDPFSHYEQVFDSLVIFKIVSITNLKLMLWPETNQSKSEVGISFHHLGNQNNVICIATYHSWWVIFFFFANALANAAFRKIKSGVTFHHHVTPMKFSFYPTHLNITLSLHNFPEHKLYDW